MQQKISLTFLKIQISVLVLFIRKKGLRIEKSQGQDLLSALLRYSAQVAEKLQCVFTVKYTRVFPNQPSALWMQKILPKESNIYVQSVCMRVCVSRREYVHMPAANSLGRREITIV